MAKPGPAPTPTALLRLTGSDRPRRRDRSEPRPRRASLKCPAWLTGLAAEAWDVLAPTMDRLGLLTEIDINPLARYCRVWARWRAAEEVIDVSGPTCDVLDKDGRIKYVQQRPEVNIAANLLTQLLKLEQEFGMSPSSRARVRATTPDDLANPFAEFLNRGRKSEQG